MIELDPRTMYVVLAVGCLTMACALTVANLRGAHLRAITYWALGNYAQCLAWSLYSLHWVIPPLWSLVVAFVALSVGFALQFAAVFAFSGRRTPWPPILFALAAGSVLHTYFVVSPGGDHWALIVASIYIGLLGLACAAALFGLANPGERFSYWMTGIFFGTVAIASIYRGIDIAINAGSILSLMTVNGVQTVTLGLGYVTVIGTSLGFIMMTKERADSELLRVASTDMLTGLLNRRTLEEAAAKELARVRRSPLGTSVLMCDLDYFKAVNDEYGHVAGDLVLMTFGNVLRENLRPFDIVGRYGGEEFCVILPGTNPEAASMIAERIRTAAAGKRVHAGNGGDVGCTVSIGVAGMRRESLGLEDVFKGADEALYAAKAAGRNCVRSA